MAPLTTPSCTRINMIVGSITGAPASGDGVAVARRRAPDLAFSGQQLPGAVLDGHHRPGAVVEAVVVLRGGGGDAVAQHQALFLLHGVAQAGAEFGGARLALCQRERN